MPSDTAPDQPWSFLISTDDLRKVIEDAVAEDRKHRGGPYPAPFTRTYRVTEGEWRVLIANAEHPTQTKAAASLGMHPQTFKNAMTTAKRRLQASSQLDMYMRLGWLSLPEDGSLGDVPDALTVRGHSFVHVAACLCCDPNSREEV